MENFTIPEGSHGVVVVLPDEPHAWLAAVAALCPVKLPADDVPQRLHQQWLGAVLSLGAALDKQGAERCIDALLAQQAAWNQEAIEQYLADHASNDPPAP